MHRKSHNVLFRLELWILLDSQMDPMSAPWVQVVLYTWVILRGSFKKNMEKSYFLGILQVHRQLSQCRLFLPYDGEDHRRM